MAMTKDWSRPAAGIHRSIRGWQITETEQGAFRRADESTQAIRYFRIIQKQIIHVAERSPIRLPVRTVHLVS
jgi:hypothetical protein